MTTVLSIERAIVALAAAYNAPAEFVQQVRELFIRRGVSLDSPSTPFQAALVQAFQREDIERKASAVNHRMEAVQDKIRRATKICQDNAKKLVAMHNRLKHTHKTAKKTIPVHDGKHVTIKGDHRTLVLPFQRDNLQMVPGPKGIQ